MKRVKFFIGVLCIGLLFTACSDSDEETTKHVSNAYYVEYETLKSLYEAGSIDNVTAFLESKGFERYSQTAITQTEDKVVYMKVNDGETVVFHLCVDNTNNTIKSLHYYIPDESKSELLNIFNAYSSALQKVYSSAGYNGVLLTYNSGEKMYGSHSSFLNALNKSSVSTIYMAQEVYTLANDRIGLTYAPMDEQDILPAEESNQEKKPIIGRCDRNVFNKIRSSSQSYYVYIFIEKK